MGGLSTLPGWTPQGGTWLPGGSDLPPLPMESSKGTRVAQPGAGGEDFSIPIPAPCWGCSKAPQACSPRVLSPYKPGGQGDASGNPNPSFSALSNGAGTARTSQQAASSPRDGKAAAPFRAKI